MFFIIKNNKFVNKRKKGIVFKKQKYFRWFAVNTCPPGQVLAGPDTTKSRLFVKFRTFWFENLIWNRKHAKFY